MAAAVGDLVVRECRASEFADCAVVFSGLDSDVAGEIGMFCLCLEHCSKSRFPACPLR